jgi:hypothetical protein
MFVTEEHRMKAHTHESKSNKKWPVLHKNTKGVSF